MADSMTIGKLLVQLLLDDEQYEQGIQDAKATTKTLGVDLSYLADMLNSMVTTAFQAATVAATGLAVASGVVGATFESKMQQVGVIAGAVGEEMVALEEKARELGSTTNYSASEAADAMALLAGAGLDTNEVLAATGDSLNLAGAGGTNLDTAASALTATMAQFSLTADQAGRIADVFAASTAKSQFTVEDLSEAMKYGGTVGAGFGWSLEQTVAALAQFRDMGLQGSAAGTALRSAMVGATTASARNIEVLARYGLTMADINPEVLTFEQILTNVGKAGVTTSDAMVVFGSEAGAVVSTLAQKFAAGESSYRDMLASLENASGTATSMYADMTNTVLGRFQNLQSAIEEFFLTIFDQYSGPILGLLDALSNVVNRISQEVTGRSGEIQASLTDAFGAVTDWLNENADYIATSIAGFLADAADFATEVRGILPYLSQMLPLLDDLALLMGLVWVSTKVAAFAAAIGDVVVAINAAGAGMRGFMVVMTQATGGIYALVAAIGTLLAGLVYLINQYAEAEMRANRLKEAQDRLKQKAVEDDVDRLNQLEETLNLQQIQARQELEHSDTMSDARRRELEQLSELTAQEALRLEQQGKLVVVGGELRQVGSIIDELDPETVRALDGTIASLRTNAREAKDRIAEWEAGLRRAEAAMDDGREATGQYVQTILSQAGITATSYEDAQAQLELLRAEQARMASQARALETDRAKAVGALREAEVRNVQQAEQAKLTAGEQALGKGEAREQEYVDRVASLHQGLKDELAAQDATELERLNLQMERRAAELKAAYDEQIKAAGTNAAEVSRLQEQYRQDELTLLSIWAGERDAIIRENAKKEADARAREAERIQGIISGLEERGLTESERLEREKAEVLSGIALEYGSERQRIAELYDVEISAARTREAEEAADAEESSLERFQEAMQEAGAVASDVFRGIGSVVSTVTGVIDGAARAAQDFIGFFAGGLASLTGFAFDLFEAIDAVVGIMEDARESSVTMTGPGGMSVSTGGGPLASAETAANAYVGSMVEAAITFVETAIAAVPSLLDALIAGLPRLIEALVAAIPLVVQSIVAALPGLVDTFVEQAPLVIQALVDALPLLVQAVIDALPRIVQFVLDALPTIIQPLINAASDLVNAVVLELPVLVEGLVALIPDLIAGILGALPTIIENLLASVADIVVAIVGALPEIVTNIINAIPAIITSLITGLVGAIPEIVLAVLEAVPDIIVGVVQGIPAILRAVLQAIPDIITMVIQLVPDIIIAVVEMIPEILPALVALIPQLIVEIVAALPQILVALVEGLIVELLFKLPEIAAAIGSALLEALNGVWEEIVGMFEDLWGAITGTGTSSSGAKDEGGDWVSDTVDAIGGWLDDTFGGGASAYDGISYVPATMRMTLHPGEAVVPAHRNPAGRGRGRADPPLAGGAGGGAAIGAGAGGARVELAVFANGRDVDRIVVESMGRGQATEIKRTVRSMSGLKAGLDRGRYNRWNK